MPNDYIYFCFVTPSVVISRHIPRLGTDAMRNIMNIPSPKSKPTVRINRPQTFHTNPALDSDTARSETHAQNPHAFSSPIALALLIATIIAVFLLIPFFRIFWPIIGINIFVLFVVRRRSGK